MLTADFFINNDLLGDFALFFKRYKNKCRNGTKENINILAASLSEDEKQSKIKELENEKFNEQERTELEIIEIIKSNKTKQK